MSDISILFCSSCCPKRHAFILVIHAELATFAAQEAQQVVGQQQETVIPQQPSPATNVTPPPPSPRESVLREAKHAVILQRHMAPCLAIHNQWHCAGNIGNYGYTIAIESPFGRVHGQMDIIM